MVKGVNPSPSPSPNPSPAPNPTPSPSPTGTGGGNAPRGNTGFSMSDSSMQGLQNKAGDLGSRLSAISSGLRGLNFSGNALGPIGLFAVPALNASNDNAVSQADKGAKAFTDVQSNLKATHQTASQTDQTNQKNLQSFDTSTTAKPPPGSNANAPGLNAQGGANFKNPDAVKGGAVNTPGLNAQGGANFKNPDAVKGGTGPAGGLKGPGGGPAVLPPASVKGGGPAPTGGLNAQGGPSVSTAPPVKGGGPGVTGGPKGGVGGPAVGAVPPVKGGAGPVAGGGPKGAGGPGFTAPPVVGGGANPGSAKPGATPGGGGKGGAVPPVSTPGGKGGVPTPPSPSAAGPKPGVTPPGPQSAVTSPSTGGLRGATPPGTPGMAPPMAPGATPGSTGGERGGSKFGAGGGKGVFDAPKPGSDSTISKAPPNSASAAAQKPGSTPPVPGAGSPNTGSPAVGSPKPGVPATPPPSAPGQQSTVTTQPQSGAPRGGVTPGVTPPAAAAPPAAPPMAPGGANPAAGTSERGGSKLGGPAPSKGVFDAPKPPTPDNTISRAPSTSPSTPPPPPKPTPLSPSPAANTAPPANAPSANPNTAPPAQSRPAPPVNAPGANPNAAPTTSAPGTTPNTAPPAQTRPAPPASVGAPPANAPSPNANTAPPTQTRPAPAAPPAGTPNVNSPKPDTNVPPAAQPKPTPAPAVQTRPAPSPAPSPNPNPNSGTSTNATPDLVVTPPVVAPAPNTDTNTSANTRPAQPNVVPRSNPAAQNYQAQPRPDGGRGRKRAAIKKWLGIDFIKGLFNKPPATPVPAPAPTQNTNTNQNTTSPAPADPWVGLVGKNADPSSVDLDTLKSHVDTAVNDGKPGKARVLINRVTDPDTKAELQQQYDQSVQNKGDAGKVEVPKELHFAWFGNTPSPAAVQGMKEWGAKVQQNNGANANPNQQWKATLWTDSSANGWDPQVVQDLSNAGIEIRTNTPDLVTELSNDVQSRTDTNTTINDVYAAAQNPDAKAYNLAADIARYAVLAKNGGVYVDVDIRPGAVDLAAIGDMKMQPTDVPVFAPRLRDQTSVNETLQGQNVAPGTELDTAANIQYGKGELNNNFIVAPPGNGFINTLADIIPQKFEGLKAYGMTDAKFNAELKAQAPDISGPNALVDGGLKPTTGVISQFTMNPDNHGLKVEPGISYLPPQMPLVEKSDYSSLFDPELKNKWSGLEWVTPESESQLDTDNRPAPNDNTPNQTRGGGAPPPMPATVDHQGKDVLTDESWRHDPAKTSDWSQPDNPADRGTWADRRDNHNVRTVDQVVHDVRTDSTPSNIKSYQGLINYDLRRIETSPGNFVQEYTVKVHIDPAANADPDVVQQVKDNATNGVDNLLNQGFRLPSGDQFHLNLEFTNNPADAHTTIKVDPGNPNVDQTHWNPDTSPEVLAHETLHYLGVPDEYKDTSRVFQQHDTNSGVHQNDGSMMGADVRLADPGIRPRHLWLIERTANSQVMVPDTRIEPPGPATVPLPPGWTPKPAPDTNAGTNTTPTPDTKSDTRPDAGTRPMPDKHKHGWDSDSDAETGPEQNKKPRQHGAPFDPAPYDPGAGPSDAGPSTMDIDPPVVVDSQVEDLTSAFKDLQLEGVSYNKAFENLGKDGFDLPTKDDYLAKLKESVEENKPPSFVVNMIVNHNQLGEINSVIDAITADAGPKAKDMVFVVGVNGREGSNVSMDTDIETANNSIANRKEPIALVPLPEVKKNETFPFGKMRNETMHNPATTFAVGAMNGKGTHPYISFQDFDSGSRRVPSPEGAPPKDIFNHFTESLNPPGVAPLRPLLYSGGYRVGDPDALINDTQRRIDTERARINAKDTKTDKDTKKLESLNKAEKELSKPEEFVKRFEQAMRDDMDARSRQKDSAPMLPYSPEPNLFMDANVAVVDPDVKFGPGGNEFGDLSKSINKFAGNEIVDIHTKQLPPPPKPNESLADAKAKLEADIKAQGGTPSPSQAKNLESLDAGIKKVEQDIADLRAEVDARVREINPNAPQADVDALVDAMIDKDAIDSGIDVDLKNNTNPLRGETFSTDFVNGAVATDLSRLALGFAESAGTKWPQSHHALTNPTSRMYSGPTPDLDRAAKADVSGAKIRDEFTEKFDRKGDPKADNKSHTQREAQQVVEHRYDYDPETGVSTRTETKGGWTPSKLDALHLGWEDKNSLDGGISTPVDGHGHIGIDPEVDTSTVYPPPLPKDSKGRRPDKKESDVAHIVPSTKQHKMAAMLNLAMSSNPGNVTRMFGTLEAGVLPIAADPRPDGIYNAVHDALGGKSAADLRAGAVQNGWTASPAITKQIARFRQEHGLENGHIVNAMIEPGLAPKTGIPASFRPNSGDVAVDNSLEDPGAGPITPAEADTHAQENAAEQRAENAKQAKAEELAAKLLATEIGRPLRIHGPDGDVQTIKPFFEPAPEITPTSKPAEVNKAKKWKEPKFGAPLELDARPNPNGRTTYTPHAPANDPGEGSSRGSTRGAPPLPETQTRPAPPRPTPNPVIPMTTTAPRPVGQVPDTNLPSFFQDNKALGSIVPTDVRGADAVVNEIQGLKPNDQARIKDALENDFETFLGNGRNFQVKIGGSWFEANVRAEMHADTNTTVTDAADSKVDRNFQAAAASTTTNTIATSNDVGGSATAGVAMGPYGSLGGRAALATPAVSQATTNTITEQRAIRSDGGSKQVTVPVSFEITVNDAAGNPVRFATLGTGPDVTLQVPTDLSDITGSGKTSDVVTPTDADWGSKVENAVPEAVTVKDSGKAFNDVAAKLHPSITKVGSPGREVLQNFLSPTSIRNNLPAMLGGFVTSPDLVSPHAGKGGAVQMSATLKDAKLVGTHDKAALDLNATSAWGSSVSAATKTGFDVTAGFGGNIGVPGQVGGTVGGTLNYSARTAEGVSAGSSTNRRTGIGVKNETGLYEVTAEVEVRTPSGDSVKMEVTTHLRMGLNEAGAVGLPTPDGSRNTITDPATADTRYLPPYLADTLAAGNATVGEFVPATKVQSQVEGALRNLPGFSRFLPNWNNPDANPRSSKGQSFSDVADQLANQRKLTANLSPAALKANMDSLLGPGVQVQLKNSGRTTNTYVNVTVKAKVSNPRHLGQADARPVSDSTTTGPKLDSSTTTTKGWTGGVQGRVNIPVKTGVASLTPMPQAGVSYSHSWTDKTSAGPAVSSTLSNPGSPDAQVFQQDVEFEVEITTFTRPRTWVRNIVPGAPGFHSPEVKTVAKTGAGLDKIDGKVNLWVSDSSTLKTDPGDGFKPGDPRSTKIENSPTVKDLLNPKDPRPKSPEFLNVEAVANTTELRDQAIDALNRAANGDSALTTPGTASRAQIDRMFTPENIKANLQRLIQTGVQEQGLKYDRRVTDRSGAIGMSVKLGDAKLVSISDTTGADNSVSGGYTAGESSTTSRSVDVTAGVNVPVRPNVTPPPAGTPSSPSGSGGAAVTGRVTPWSDTRTESNEIGGNVDRGRTTPGDARTVLVQIDAEFTIVGESRAGNFVHGGTPNAEGVTVNLPKSVFVRVSEDVARDLGVLPKVESSVPKPDFPKMAPPSTVAVGEPGALGLSTVESVPNLSGVVNDLTSQLSANTKKFGSDALVPDSVLKDSMSNLQRIVDLNAPASVKAMIDSALDGGVPLLVHQPGTFGKDSYQVTLRARTGEPTFNQVVNDGVDMTHNNGGSRKQSAGQGRGSGWGASVRAPGLAAPGSANPNVSGTAGGAVGANVGASKSSSVTTSVNEAFGNARTASGPAAQYTVPVEFELVVEKGSKEIARATSGDQEMVVRTHADNQKVSQPTTGHPNPQPYMSAASKRGSELGTPEATFAFQQDSRATQLPPTASVENLRGASDLRDAAVKALAQAGAGKGLTGKGTGSLNSLLATLSPENLQPHLPSMLSGPLDVPGLKEAALTFGQDADVKVYAKLVNPRLGSLSDSVRIESPLTTKTSETSSEAKKSETADVSVGLAQGSAAVKQGAPADTVNFSTGGVEARHANEDSSAVSGGPAQAEGGNIKPKDAPRTGLVQFDVEYRVVATIGGRTGVVDLTVPGSAGVRMPDTAVETVLDHQLGDSLKDAQTEVKKAADDWRTAEKEVETARHEAQDAINEAAAVLARTDQPAGDAATALNTAIDAHLDAEAKLPALQAAAAGTQAEVANTRAHIQELNPRITSLSQEALSTKDALDDAQINGAPQAELDRLGQEADTAHNALTDAQQQLTDAHSDLDAQRKAAADARAELQAQQRVVAQADKARADAEATHQKLIDERAAAEKAITDAETKLDDARRTADAKQQEWWNAKAKVDNEIDSFNAAAQSPPPGDTSSPASPVDAPTPSHSTDSGAPWFDPRNPVPSQSIADARATTPATSWVRGEDAGVFDNTTISPGGIDMKAWRGPIAYDNRVLDVDGVPVRDFTVRLHLDNGDTDVQDRTRAGVEEMFNQGYRLPGGEQFHVTVEFTGNPADAHATINVTDDPEGRANQLTWPSHTDSRRLAHEVGHFLGLRDEYLETDDVKPIFQHQDGRGHVVADNSPMTAGIGKADARLKPRHLELIESRMRALQSHHKPRPEPFESDLPAPNTPKRERPDTMDVDREGDPSKRLREDDPDAEMTAPQVELVNEGGVHNAAFESLAGGRTLTPITAENYLQRTKDGIANNEPPAFVVSMIVRAGELDQLNDVINGVMADTGDLNGRVAFVLGVNAASQQDIADAMAAAAATVNGRTEPIALVSVPHGPKGFRFGETRNTTLNSNAHEYAVTALAANGRHPYVSIMDFDAGDRRTREGTHVFEHVEQLLHAEEVGPADGPDTPAPLRPLLVGGGYRVAITPEQLRADVLARIDGDTKTNEAQKQAYRERLNEEGFADRFVHMIDADMHARRTQQGIHPLLPYTPEPNLFFDALVPLADPTVRFGEGAAEFGQLASSLNRFHAVEIAAHHDPRTAQERSGEVPVDQAKLAAAAEQVRVDVQNNRDPVRGQAFTTDFVSGDTGTDLSRIAYGLITDGKLPQSHTALPNVSERFFDGKAAKKGTAFAEERARLSAGEQRVVEPFRPPAEGQTTNTWNPPDKVNTQLGAPARNRMNPAVSAPMPAPFNDQQAGVQSDQKVVAAHGIVASDHLNHTLRQVRHLNTDVLRGQNPPPTTDTGLYAAVGAAKGVNPAALRLGVVQLAARNPAVAKAVADFTVSRPMHDGHMVGALVENVNWHMQPDARENSGAGNARDLVGHLIATQQQVNVRIHQPGGNPVLLRPMGEAVTATVDIEMVMNGRQVTYRPYRGPQGLHQDEPML